MQQPRTENLTNAQHHHIWPEFDVPVVQEAVILRSQRRETFKMGDFIMEHQKAHEIVRIDHILVPYLERSPSSLCQRHRLCL